MSVLFTFIISISLVVFSVGNFLNALNLPPGFAQVQVVTGLINPTVMAFAPDGRLFVAQQNGALKVIKNGNILMQPFVFLSVDESGGRGFLGIAFDPDFNTNQYIYLYYTLLSGANNRISRFTADGDVAVPGSEMVLLDLDPLSTATNHNGGSLQFGTDGYLYVGVGENDYPANSQNLNTYHGKILRIKTDGGIPTGNPFTTGTAQKKRIWSYGVRNPFTLAVQPGTGKIFVNDVGQVTYEEIDNATLPGHNFGWPAEEGPGTNFVSPVYSYGHGSANNEGCAITGGTFFNPPSTNYPAKYTGCYFFVEHCNDWIGMLTPNGSSWTDSTFATGIALGSIGIITGNDGNLYFLSRSGGAVYKIIYNPTGAPVITNQPKSISKSLGNAATFSVSAKGAAALNYQWSKNGIKITGAVNPSYTIASVVPADSGNYRVKVSNSVDTVFSKTVTLTVTGPNNPPVAVITSPAAGTTYAAGSSISFTGTGTDPQDGILPASAFRWYVEFHHDTHLHPGPTAPDGLKSGSFYIPDIGEIATMVYYRLVLVVTDAHSATDTAFVDIMPRLTTVTMASNPPGLKVTFNGQPFITPYSIDMVEGMVVPIGAIFPQTIDNALTYNYTNWTPGGAMTHNITIPVNDKTYTANYEVQLRNPNSPGITVAGLNYDFYTGTWTKIPDFDLLTPVAAGTVNNFDLTQATQADFFGFRFNGFIHVPSDGIYTFYTTSNDGSRLYIGDDLVVDNDGLHIAVEKMGRIGLKAGKHAITVDYFDRVTIHKLIVKYEGPGINKKSIPASALSILPGTQRFYLSTTADAYVQDGIYDTINYGSVALMKTKQTSLTDDIQKSFLKFDISALTGVIISAKLRLYGNIKDASANVEVYNVSDNNWAETAITAANQPPHDSNIVQAKTVGDSLQYYSWDLLSYFAAKQSSGESLVSIMLYNDKETPATRAKFNTKEAANYQPQLIIITKPAPIPKQLPAENAIDNNESHVGISLFPDPASDYITVQSVLDVSSIIKIYGITGELIKTAALKAKSEQTININDMPPGVYLINIANENGIFRQKLTVIRE
ncbi:MAG: PQQ-dependent sugar dehydrogenase [Bacteroidia bacterium]